MESLIVYFIIFLVISSLLKRLTQAQRKPSGEEVKAPPQRPERPVPQRPVPPSARPRPSTYPPRTPETRGERTPSVPRVRSELRERPKSIGELIREQLEQASAEHMQEKAEQPKPPVQEPVQEQPKPSVREPIQERPKPSPVQQPPPVTRKKAVPLSPLALRFDPRSVRQGIIFSEILGPPRAERY